MNGQFQNIEEDNALLHELVAGLLLRELLQTRTKPPEISDPLDGLPPVFAKPAKYTLTYEKPGVGQRQYTISNPIAANKDSIVAYCFATNGIHPGVKSFKKQRIVAVRKL
jgi:hypothetical protein